jgi:hypothetical protein
MKCPSCGHSWQAARKPRPAIAPADTAALSTAELYAYYKKGSHIDDVRFFVNRLDDCPAIQHQAIVLRTEAEHGLPRAEVLRRLGRLQESWRTLGRPPSDEAAFWRSWDQSGKQRRGAALRAQRDRVLTRIHHLVRGRDYRGWRLQESEWDHEQQWVIRHTIELAHKARALCPATIDTDPRDEEFLAECRARGLQVIQ